MGSGASLLADMIVTVATVGYGDIAPHTPAGKALAVILILTGVGSFVAVAANAIEIMLDRREQAERMKKLNMVIGVFFEEAGAGLLGMISEWDPHAGEIEERLRITTGWTDQEFRAVKEAFKEYPFTIDRMQMNRVELHRLLVHTRDLQLQILQNPSLSEHDEFSNLLLAVFHLTAELSYRKDYQNLPENDLIHLAGDTERIYRMLFFQWIGYMQHLKNHYPFLFSLAMRTNPFDRDATPLFT
jgi:hypothetical protein